MPIRFMIIDNDPVSNLLCTLAIRDVQDAAEIQTFNFPVDGFKYLAKEYADTTNPTVLLLDINMPMWSGWDFLDNFEKLDDKIKKQFKIYLLSSSIDVNDKHRARENKNVLDYIEKPLSEKTVLSMLDQK
jgi:response regulator RpfG family c-di-GMP phosphodiesterase